MELFDALKDKSAVKKGQGVSLGLRRFWNGGGMERIHHWDHHPEIPAALLEFQAG